MCGCQISFKNIYARLYPSSKGPTHHFAHWCMAYANMFKRDIIRLQNTYSLMNECPLGCAALATTTYSIDREYTASRLDFLKPTDNSLDGVSDRDYCVELCSDFITHYGAPI